MSTRTALLAHEQYCLFDIGINIAELRDEMEAFVKKAKAPNTVKAYKHSWGVFADWCAASASPCLPSDSVTLRLFITWAARKYRVETIRLQLSAIRDQHESNNLPSPIDDEVATVLEGIVRQKREERNGKDALRVDQLRKICARLRSDDPIDVRNRALILVGFASAWRRSELASLAVRDVTIEPRGARLWIPQSKTDQKCEGEETEIIHAKDPAVCPVRALEHWLRVRGRTPGPLFVRFRAWGEMTLAAISGQQVANVLKDALANIGEDPTLYGAHSLRSGMITAAVEKNVPLPLIMQHSRHKRVDTMMRYVKRGQAFASNPLAKVL
jgi:integrase